MRETRIEVAGVATSVAESGTPGAEEAILAVHGNPGSRHDWLGLLDALGEQHRTIALDLPGFGEADKPKAFAYDVPGYAAWLDAALTVLGVRRVHLLLHDWGGPFGVAWALRDPSRVASLAAVNAGGVSRDYRWHGFARAWQVPVLGELIQYTTTGPTFRASMAKLNPRPLAREDLDRMWRLNRVGAGLTPAPPTPPDMRVRIRRFASHPGNGDRTR